MADANRASWITAKAILKLLKIPGTDIGPGVLLEAMDELAGAESEDELFRVINAISRDSGAILKQLAQLNCHVGPDQIKGLDRTLAEAVYRRRVADQYLYADFKGIEQMERFIPLKLDDVFVDLSSPLKKP